MTSKKNDAHFKELRMYLKNFPYDYEDKVFEIFSELPKSRTKDSILSQYLNLIKEKKNSTGQLLRDYVHIFEKLFFFLLNDRLKEKFSRILLDFYLVKFSENEKLYKKKIGKVQRFLGKELADLPQFKKEKSFLNLHLGQKKIFSIVSNLFTVKGKR